MTLTAAEIQRLSKLARISVPEDEVPRVQADLGRILELFEQLKQVDTSGVEPMVQAIEISNVLAPDHVAQSLRVEEVLKNSPTQDESFFKVPPVLG